MQTLPRTPPGSPAAEAELETLWGHAEPFPYFLARIRQLRPLWEGTYRNAVIPAWALEAYGNLPNGLLMLSLNADWCLDSATVMPLLARLAERVPGVELRLLERDSYPEVMDRYLTDGTRSIPLVILLDRDFRELGHWGPRPAELQSWVRAHLADLPKEERQREQRRWYARDRGETVLREILQDLGLRTED
jgi:hypothetical protein